MYTFIDNWCGDHYEFSTFQEAKKEAKNHTCGFPVYIYKGSQIVAIVPPKENPLP